MPIYIYSSTLTCCTRIYIYKYKYILTKLTILYSTYILAIQSRVNKLPYHPDWQSKPIISQSCSCRPLLITGIYIIIIKIKLMLNIKILSYIYIQYTPSKYVLSPSSVVITLYIQQVSWWFMPHKVLEYSTTN